MQESQVIPISKIYPDLAPLFPDFNDKLATFLDKNKGKVVDSKTSKEQAAENSQELIKLMTILARGIKERKINHKSLSLYTSAIRPAVKAGLKTIGEDYQVGLVKRGASRDHKYHVLDRIKTYQGLDFLLLNQRVPYGVDTGAELHDQGIEIYLPLTDGITFYVNDQVIKPKPLEELVVILPGDVHHHVKVDGHGPARVLIMAGFGFGTGRKLEPPFPQQNPIFAKIERRTAI